MKKHSVRACGEYHREKSHSLFLGEEKMQMMFDVS